MRTRPQLFKRFVVVGAIMLLPGIGYAQEAAIGGTVTDSTGGVLPGATVRAVHEASGNSFEAVTDGLGTYRVPVRIGIYRLTAELDGFATVTRSGVELLVGQQAVVNIQLSPGAVQETLTVTGESPLIDVTQSSVGGNIDRRQMQELPVNGRNWQDLAILAPGNRANAVREIAIARDGDGSYQVNVDGQQVTQYIGASTSGQPRFSRDAIEEFQFIANRFDATQGRSSGIQINVVTKSGTNTPSGTASGYFRNDRFIAADFVQGRVLPYSNQQLSGTFGGPIRKDKVHIFGNYEYEREPLTIGFTSQFPSFNLDQTITRREHKGGARLDVEFSPRTRLMVRGGVWDQVFPYDGTGGATSHPSTGEFRNKKSDQLLVSLTQILGARAVNELKVGRAKFTTIREPSFSWANNPRASEGITRLGPFISFRSYAIGGATTAPQEINQTNWQVRDDFTFSFAKGGRHDLKAGGEYLLGDWQYFVCRSCAGNYDAQNGPIPANIEALFPVWNDPSTWNLAALSPLMRTFTIGVGNMNWADMRHVTAAWLQDDWAITPRLTLNLGLRYDLAINAFREDTAFEPFLEAGRPQDLNNVGPRLGFAFSPNDRTVIRGGFGKYFAEVASNDTDGWAHIIQLEVVNDGRPDFAANPFNGPVPTFEQAVQKSCHVSPVPGCYRRSFGAISHPDSQFPYSYQGSIGLERQLGELMAVQADYVYTGGREELESRNVNLSYDPATGANYPFTDISRRPYPNWGTTVMDINGGRSDYHALQTGFTKRFSRRWQASGTYTLSALWDEISSPDVGFAVAPDLGGERTLAAGDQRHRAVFNGIWQPGHGLQLSGLYFFGSGTRYTTTYGGDLRREGANATNRLRPNGTIVPRNDFVGQPIHRVDLRLQQRVPLRRAGVDLILEVFNLFNHANYGSYVTAESNAQYGRPQFDANAAFRPRLLQFGFRFAF